MVRPANQTVSYEIQRLRGQLQEARTQPNVKLAFKDGRIVDGAITFVERLGTGRLINVDREFSLDFNIVDLRDVTY